MHWVDTVPILLQTCTEQSPRRVTDSSADSHGHMDSAAGLRSLALQHPTPPGDADDEKPSQDG